MVKKEDVERNILTCLGMIPDDQLPDTLILSDEEYRVLTGKNPAELYYKLRPCYQYIKRDPIRLLSEYQYRVIEHAKRIHEGQTKDDIEELING